LIDEVQSVFVLTLATKIKSYLALCGLSNSSVERINLQIVI